MKNQTITGNNEIPQKHRANIMCWTNCIDNLTLAAIIYYTFTKLYFF